MPERKKKNRDCFQERLGRHHDELRWLYMELYNNGDMFGELCDTMQSFYKERSDSLKELDGKREESPEGEAGAGLHGGSSEAFQGVPQARHKPLHGFRNESYL